MVSLPEQTQIRVYTVNGAPEGSSSSLPDWLIRKRALAKNKGKREAREHFEGTIELIQGFEFPEASIRIKTTRDGHHAIASGTYKPQMRVWDLDNLSLKFERHTDAENVDFICLSDDWTKSIHLQNDRTIELHTQGGFHYRTRIPRFGRSLGYHFPSCDVYVSASGNEIYRLNLDQGRFMSPLVLSDGLGDGENGIIGVNVVDINPAHQLLAFGVEGNASVQFWDPRSRSRVGVLRLPTQRLLPTGVGESAESLSVTAIASRADGLSYAIGTTSGHTLLYDIRSPIPFATKDQGYGLAVKSLCWIEGGSRMAGDGMVLSADKKVIKIWDRSSPTTNFASITPAADINDVHHVPGSGLLMLANEGIKMTTYYVPQLGPAPRWASFLENITEEMEDQTTRTVYEDYKFVGRGELKTLGLDHLVGTPMLKPYMHGYFVSLKLYDAARVIANPYAYAEHREKLVKDKMEKLADTRIRAKKEVGVKVNKALAEKIQRDEERARNREERRKLKRAEHLGETPIIDGSAKETLGSSKEVPSLLNDPRFSRLFEDPDFAVDEDTREYALMNPSAAAQKRSGTGRSKTAVESEEEETDKISSDGLEEDSSEDDNSADDGVDESDSSDEGALNAFDPRRRPGQKNARAQEAYTRNRERNRIANVPLVPMRTRVEASGNEGTFGQRRLKPGSRHRRAGPDGFDAEGGLEMSWVPDSSVAQGEDAMLDSRVPHRNGKSVGKRKGVEEFGAGMEKGGEPPDALMTESDRKGRSQRRIGVRSGSKNTFRRM